ncbi:MAG: hypothetical protein IJT31_02155 [Oscillibacter sp.]|nr:hypothetical protein [Oscillibacter sp.]
MRRYCRLLAILTVLLLLLTACGGGGEEEPGDEFAPLPDEETLPDKSATPDISGEEIPDEPDAENTPDTETVPNAPDADAPPDDTETPEVSGEPDEGTAQLFGGVLPEVNIVGEGVNVGALSYEANPDSCTVYLPEDGAYVPFLVLTADYAGNTLLLRRDVLPEVRPFNNYSAVYPDSDIDRYLNTEYVQYLDAVQPLIPFVDITVTAPDALGVSGDAVQTISREIFLLSCTETGFTDLVNAGKEGDALSYFGTPEHRTATRENGAAVSWWLRTPDTYYLSAAYGIGPDGSLGSGNAYNENGIRPAFCVPSDTVAFPTTDILPGQTVYFLSA